MQLEFRTVLRDCGVVRKVSDEKKRVLLEIGTRLEQEDRMN